MNLPLQDAGDRRVQQILQGREEALLTRGALRYLPKFGEVLLSYFRHELEGSNRVYERMEKVPGYVEQLQSKDMFRLFPRLMISPEMALWIATYGPFGISITPGQHEKGYKEQQTKVAIPDPDVTPDHLTYLLNLSDESSITAVTQPPRLTISVIERSTPHISLNTSILAAAKKDYKHRFPTAVVSTMYPKPIPEGLDYQGMSPLPLAKVLSERFPTEDDYRRAENDRHTGFAELLEVLGIEIKGLLESDRTVTEAYARAWKLPRLE